ncbi:hypothetical protein [Pseudomonas sp. CM27]|uniref:hypothetical protein n=1 Tax=Pseudomonas sp. CM27 TaxID=2738452 RepID=UPI0015579D9B|nr:hypothetical protein [Pseudomonas sp. CM27]NQD78394.1 hypothetical protein [Pseudomonas sp. CM27]
MALSLRLVMAFTATLSLTTCTYAQSHTEQTAASAARDKMIGRFNEALSTQNQPKFSILKTLNFQSSHYQETIERLDARYTYPQGFQIDEERELVYVLRYSNGRPTRGVIEKYHWKSGEIMMTYIIPEPQPTVSEGLVIKKETDGDVAYIRSGNTLARLLLIDSPSGFGNTQRLGSVANNVAQSFYHKDNEWFVEKFKISKDSLGESRGRYMILDSEFNTIGEVTFAPQYAGYRNSEKWNIPKHQGFAVLDNGYAMTMGGYWDVRTKTSPYNYFGINFFDKNGKPIKSEYMSPEAFSAQIAEMGIQAYSIENEGLQELKDGKLVTLQIIRTQGGRGGKLLFLLIEP